MSRTLFVLQGGGPTAVINATLAGIAESATGSFDELLGFRHSFEPCSENKLCNLTPLLGINPDDDKLSSLDNLAITPGALLGSSRTKVDEQALRNALNTMREKKACDLIGIGGNGTLSVLNTLSEYAQSEGYPLNIIGAPKTVDNDLVGVHAAPGYGSAARFIAMAVRDFDCDFRAMSTFDNVTILETMGRNCGWIAAASVLLKQCEEDAPHIVLLPEQPFDESEFLDHVANCHARFGRVFIVTNEMLSDRQGAIVGEAVQLGPKDTLGRPLYSLSSGTGNFLSNLIWTRLGLQARCLRPGNLGRSLSFCTSETDRTLAMAVGREAVTQILAEENAAHMIAINEELKLSAQHLKHAAGEKSLPDKYRDTQTPFTVHESFKQFVEPLVGEIQPLFDGKQFD